tara:strand:+ start:3355 stop:3675 length:321 start_codon:yes stop_codon:yes gene_type:complete
MLNYLIFILSLTVGSYTKELITNDILSIIKKIEPIVDKHLDSEGYNGIYPEKGTIEEVWSQIVNGVNYIAIKKFDNDSLCIKFHESIEGTLGLETVKPCTSVFDVI